MQDKSRAEKNIKPDTVAFLLPPSEGEGTVRRPTLAGGVQDKSRTWKNIKSDTGAGLLPLPVGEGWGEGEDVP